MTQKLIMVGLAGVLVLSGVGGVAATAAASSRHPGEKSRCPSKTKYLQALTATDNGGAVTIKGHHAEIFCDREATFIKTQHANATFTLVKGATIKVYRHLLRPDSAYQVSAKKFPHYLKHAQQENWYTFKGKSTAVKSIYPAFQS